MAKLSSPLASGWRTSEFGTTIGLVISDLIAFFSTIYLISPQMGLTPTEKIAAVGALFAYITGTSVKGVMFDRGRVKLKEKALDKMRPVDGVGKLILDYEPIPKSPPMVVVPKGSC